MKDLEFVGVLVQLGGKASELNLRIPSWSGNGAKASLNGESLDVPLPGKN